MSDLMHEINTSRVVATCEGEPDSNWSLVSLALPNGPASGLIINRFNDRGYAVLNHLWVPPELREQGIATRLVSAVGWLATRYANDLGLMARVESPYTMRILKGLWGAEALRFVDVDDELEVEDMRTLTADGAVAALERATAFESDLDKRQWGVDCVIKLGGRALSDFEEPLVVAR